VERLILDSGALIALERGINPEIDVLPADADVVMSAVTASELIVGIELADDQRRERRQRIVEGLLELIEVVPFDLQIAGHHATLRALPARRPAARRPRSTDRRDGKGEEQNPRHHRGSRIR